MGNMRKQEVIDEMVSEGYDYDTAWRFIYGDIANSNDKEQEMKQPNCEKHSKQQCSKCKYLDQCDRASVCNGDCGRCDITDCENNPNYGRR